MGIQIPIIVVLCYLIAEVYKIIFKKSYHKYLPVVVSIIGGLLGVIIYFTKEFNIQGVSNIYDYLLIGITSGASSTGTNQIIKKIFLKE